MTKDERRVGFEALVLQGIWLCIWLLARILRNQGGMGSGFTGGAPKWRADAISYFDLHGNQSDGAKAHRREQSFPDIPQG